MKILQLATLVVAAAWLGVCASAGDTAGAEETYRRTSFYEESASVSVIAFSPDAARIAFATEERKVHIRETTAGNEIAWLAIPSALAADDDYIHFLAFSPDGALVATASRDKLVHVWDIANQREIAALKHPSMVASIRFSPDGARLATLSDTTVRLWNVAQGRELAVLDHPSAVASAAFSSHGARLVTGCTDGTAHVWDATSGREITLLQGHTDTVKDARFSPDGARIVTASRDGAARIWDAASGRELLAFELGSPVLSAAFSPDGAHIVVAAGNEAHVFDAVTGRQIAILKGHDSEVTGATFSPDGARIVTASEDRTARVWDAASGDAIAVLSGHSYGVSFVAFAPDGQRILTVGGGQGIVWSRLAAVSLPEGVVGLWFNDFGTPEEHLPPEIVRIMCVMNPISIKRDGLIVFFEGTAETEPPRPSLHMRCASDLSCEIFSGPPEQGAESIGNGTLQLEKNAGNICLAGECRPVARCPTLTWTDEERSSGFADRWETSVQAPQQ
jgi:WD40 repeat protein